MTDLIIMLVLLALVGYVSMSDEDYTGIGPVGWIVLVFYFLMAGIAVITMLIGVGAYKVVRFFLPERG